ncbi:MAG: SH3 beta-barrel fold-containing protein [Petrimonas sp.]
MSLSWQFTRKNGYSRSEALKAAWVNYRLIQAMQTRIVKFYFQKVDGSVREAWGTLRGDLLPGGGDNKMKNSTVQVYYDTEKEGWRSFKKANLLQVV